MSNLAVYVAAGRKMIKIVRKTFLRVRIWKFDLEYTFLIVPGLSTDFIAGADLLKQYGGVINFTDETFEIMGEVVPKHFVSFRPSTLGQTKSISGCQSLIVCMIQLQKNSRNVNLN